MEVFEHRNNESRQFVNDVFATSKVNTSTPVIKKRISLQSVPMTSANLSKSNLNFSKSNDSKIFSDPRQQRENNLSLKVEFDSVRSFNITSPNNRSVDIVLTDSNRTLSPSNNSFPTLTRDQSSSLSASFLSQNCNQSECTENSSHTSGSSVKSDLQLSSSPLLLNRSQNPISPLYSQSMTEKPKKSQKLHNKSSEKHARKNSNFQHSTPEQSMNSSQKSVKSSSRQNLSLADFITIDTRSSKKSGKKSNQKTPVLRHSREDEAVSKLTPFLTDESFPEVGQSFEKRRRIKPTKLEISDDKGNKENAVFGVVKRPVATNPHFSEVQSTDQPSDKISFEAERDLLRLERQKKPEGAVDNKIGDLDVPIKILLKTARKPVFTKSIVVPSIAMVDRIEVLNSLVYLYSAFIDHNLISNPMTELYFIVSLITSQYLLQSPGKSAIKDPHANCIKLDKSEDLDKDLGCAILSDDDKENDFLVQSAENSKLLLETDEKLKELSLDKSKLLDKIPDEEDTAVHLKTSLKNDDLPLGTPHNSVYFSTRVLNEQKSLLKSLDRVTLKLLSENVNIAAFLPELKDYLEKLYHLKLGELNRTNKPFNLSIADPNVCFQIDTDNRETFPSAIAFQCFRKQRDLFYEILKIWEENHTKTNWNFSLALSGKIKSMLTLHSDVTNHSHIARLFKSQLLISCIQTGQQEDFFDDESLNILKSLKGFNPEKLTQLKERLVTPLSSKGPVPEPTFSGVQEFYKNFILFAFNPMFYAHLEDCLIHEIMDLNEAQFTGSDIEDSETMVDERTKQNFITCLSSLRILAKFTGFLVSLPYRSTTSALEEVINAQVALRKRFVPSMDLKCCLEEALIHGKLSLTIPWIVEYLSQMDAASLRLAYYTQLLEMLYCIYRISHSDNLATSRQFMSPQTSVLIRFSIGWLFELPNFPINLYFTWQSSHTSKKLKTICQLEKPKMEVSVVSDKRNLSLDKLDIIDDRVLYCCCPYLAEFKVLLTTGNSQTINNQSNRHITPVSSQLPNTADSANIKNLEFQLEEAFFHGHPASTRKTVEFVSERVASTCVKYICNSLLPSAREKSLNGLRKVIEEKYSKNFEDDPNSLKTLMMSDMNALAASLSKQVKKQCEEVIPPMCKKRASQSIESLLAEDTLLPVQQTCIQIAIRMATDRIRQWIQSHIVGGSLFMRDMESEINRLVKSDSSSRTAGDDNHNPDGACPTDVLDDLRAFMWELLDNRGESFSLETVSKILDQLCSCFTERADLLHGPENCLRALSVDLAIFLVAHRMDFFTPEIQGNFVKFWKISLKKIPHSESPLLTLLSPRNILILEEANHDEVWLKCGEFIKLLLKEEILSLESLCDQSVKLLRQDWATGTMQNLSKCLQLGIVDYQAADEQMERIKYLIRWIAETYYRIDNLDE
ncbi:codanin-1 isoform X2 [Belonocnema kinseyi]|nr:codanin-1 isoform X2 [Belonocnema kinseyi]